MKFEEKTLQEFLEKNTGEASTGISGEISKVFAWGIAESNLRKKFLKNLP